MHTYALEAIKAQETENIRKDMVKVDDEVEGVGWGGARGVGKKGQKQEEEEERGREEENITVRPHYTKTALHKRKCIQHHSLAIEESEIEKGKSEFAHLGKTSHWRQSISNSVLLKRAR